MSSKNTKPVKEEKKWMDVKRGNCQERKEIQGFMVVAQVAFNAWGYGVQVPTYSQTGNFPRVMHTTNDIRKIKTYSLLKSVKETLPLKKKKKKYPRPLREELEQADLQSNQVNSANYGARR